MPSQDQLQTIIDTIPALAWAARPDGSVEFFNRRWLDYTGLSAEQARDWNWTTAIHPDDLNRLTDYWRSILDSGEPGEIEARLRRFDGEYRWFLFRASPLRDHSGKVVKWYGTNTDIDERKRAEEKLQRSEADLLEAQRMSRTGNLRLDVSSGTVTGSPQVFRIFGVKPDEDTSALEFWLRRNHPEDHKRIQELFDRCIIQKTDFDAEYRIVLPDGAIKHLHSLGHPVLNESGDLVEFGGTIIDITERKQAEEALRRSERDLLEAQRISHTGSWKHDVSSGTVTVSPEVFRIFGVKPDDDASTPEFWLSRNHPEDQKRIQELFARCEIEKTDYEADYRIVLPDGTIKHLHAIGCPVLNESDQLIEFIGTVLDITERKSAERQLRRSEAYLAEAQRLSSTGSFGWRPSTGEIIWSEETFRIFQYERTTTPTVELILQRVHPEEAAFVRQTIERASQDGKDFEHEHRLLMPDGSVKHVHAVAHGSLDKSGGIEFVGAISDITPRKRAEEALRKSEERWRSVFENSAVGVTLTDMNGRFLATNHVYQIMLGYTEEELRALHFLDITHEDYREANCALVTELMEGKRRQFQIEKKCRRKDGSLIWVSNNVSLVPGTDRVPRFLMALIEDITERKQAEDKVREQEVELRQILDAAPQHLSVLSSDGSHMYINQSSLDFLGLTLEEWQKSDIRGLVHPDDAERVAHERKQALSSGSPLEIEMRLRRHDGEYRWLFLHYKPLKDQLGRITRWVVPAIDIDDRKRAEERTRNENLALREQIDRESMFEDIVGSSEVLRKMLSQVSKVARSDSTVLILGETGTGKELIARAIHKRSNRAERAFIGVNCAAIPSSLVASELFGYEKGAFTGATQRRLGRFEVANGGTIFLDEVGDLPPEIQIALLRVLQEREIERVGSSKPIPVDVRVLSATHRDLNALVAEGKFRQDLLYRLNVVPIEMPSLRERAADIPLLIEYFVDRFGKKAGKKFRTIDKKTLSLFQGYGWPGNIRELQNVIERAVILSDGDIFSVDDTWLKQEPPHVAGPTVALGGALLSQEKEMIEAALAETRGRISGPAGAAAKLAIPAQTLESKIKRLGINKVRFKYPHAG